MDKDRLEMIVLAILAGNGGNLNPRMFTGGVAEDIVLGAARILAAIDEHCEDSPPGWEGEIPFKIERIEKEEDH